MPIPFTHGRRRSTPSQTERPKIVVPKRRGPGLATEVDDAMPSNLVMTRS